MSKVILIGKNYYNECGYIAEACEPLATFDSKDLAETYVLKSIVSSIKKNMTLVTGNGTEEYITFSINSLLDGFDNYDIKDYDYPNNPEI